MPIELAAKETPVITKVKELCQTIVEQPHFAGMLASVEAFMEDAGAQDLYRAVTGLQERLMSKQQQGESLTEAEIAEFEEQRDRLLANDVAREFLDARQQMEKVQSSVNRYVQMTFELGRVPLSEEALVNVNRRADLKMLSLL